MSPPISEPFRPERLILDVIAAAHPRRGACWGGPYRGDPRGLSNSSQIDANRIRLCFHSDDPPTFIRDLAPSRFPDAGTNLPTLPKPYGGMPL
jgi:hypothetical protein